MTRRPDDGLPRWPVLEDEIGEDPSRFLRFASAFALARIRGIDELRVAREWLECELEIGEYREDGPRPAVIGALNRRIQNLRQYRPDRRDATRDIDPSRKADVVFLDETGNERDRTDTASAKLTELRESAAAEAATDGGTDE